MCERRPMAILTALRRSIWCQPMIQTQTLAALNEPALTRLADHIAFVVRIGDLIALHGDLGAGKTTFARAFIQALSHPATVEVPSPTFTLVQTYQTQRLALAHFDLYRLTDPSELDELGLDDALMVGAALIEWPERAGGRLTGTRLDIYIAETCITGTPVKEKPADPDTRDVTLSGHGSWGPRLERLHHLRTFLASSGHAGTPLRYLQGDASVRRYARLFPANQPALVLMDWPLQPDGPPIRDGLPYSRIAHLAEGVRPFVAIAGALDATGLSAPRIDAQDLNGGLLITEDFGDRVFGSEMQSATPQADLWRAGVDTLVALRAHTPPMMTLGDGTTVTVPLYDAQALGIETELLLDWYWPALHGTSAPSAVRADYMHIWSTIFDRLATLPQGWALRDYHSPNLLWLPDRPAPRNVGIIDFQDAQAGPHAYDLVSLLQDARVDVSAELEAELLTHYCDRVAARDPAFNQLSFRWSFAALGAQRNCKILGIFARLAHRDGKPAYLAHIPRIWAYLARDLAHPEMAPLHAWFSTAFPVSSRHQPISAPPLTRANPVT